MIGPRDSGDGLPPPAHYHSAPVQIVPDAPILDLREVARAVIRTRWLIFAIVAASLVAGFVITKLQDPEYVGEATIFVNPRKSGIPIAAELTQLPSIAALAGVGEGGLGTEAGLLQSRAIAETIVDSLALHVSLEGLVTSRLLRIHHAPRDAQPGRYELSRRNDGTYRVTPLDDAAGVATDVITVGAPFELGNVTVSLLPQVVDRERRKFVVAVEPFDRVVRQLRSGLEVAPYSRGAQILAVRARNVDPVRAAEIPNVAADRFIRYRAELTRAEARNAVTFLNEQVDNYSLLLAEAEERLRRFREQAGVVSLPEESSQSVRQLADLEARRNLLAAERDAIRAALARADRSSGDGSGSSAYREIGAFPVFLANGAVQSLLRTLTELENELSALLVRRTPENDDVRRITERITEIETQLYQTATSYHLGLDNQIASLDASLARFGSDLQAVPLQQLTHARLVREQQLLEQIFTLLQTRLKEAEIREVEDRSDVRLLDAALVPERPVAPRLIVNLILTTFLGGMLGIGVAVVRSTVDTRVRSRDDVLLASAGLPVVGLIPNSGLSSTNGGARLGRQRLRRLIPPLQSPRSERTELVVRTAPQSTASEAYRTLRANLTLGNAAASPRVITVCSVAEGDGKSTTAANLALTMAQQGLKVILVDCDLRKPRQNVLFALSAEPGLADVLLARAELSDAIREVATPGTGVPAHVLVAGTASASPAEIIGSPAMRTLVQDLRSQYEVIILDAPPLGAASEALVLGVLGDATLLIARAAVTHKRALAEAVAHLRQLRVPLAGVVFNDAADSDMAYHFYGYGEAAS